MTPTGPQHRVILLENDDDEGLGGNAGGNEDEKLDELLALWHSLDPSGQSEVLEFAQRVLPPRPQ